MGSSEEILSAGPMDLTESGLAPLSNRNLPGPTTPLSPPLESGLAPLSNRNLSGPTTQAPNPLSPPLESGLAPLPGPGGSESKGNVGTFDGFDGFGGGGGGGGGVVGHIAALGELAQQGESDLSDALYGGGGGGGMGYAEGGLVQEPMPMPMVGAGIASLQNRIQKQQVRSPLSSGIGGQGAVLGSFR